MKGLRNLVERVTVTDVPIVPDVPLINDYIAQRAVGRAFRVPAMKKQMQNQFEIVYESPSQGPLKVLSDGETVWLTQAQMCLLFGRDQSVIARHIANIFKEGELPKEGFMQNLHKTSDVGGRPVTIYNLDVIISVGYRVKSLQGTLFRRWATRMLREMLLRRVEEAKSIAALSQRVTTVESDVAQLKSGMEFLVQQLSAPPPDPPRRRIGFGAGDDDFTTTPYGRGGGGYAGRVPLPAGSGFAAVAPRPPITANDNLN